MILRCTRKLLTELGTTKLEKSSTASATNPFEEWYANLVRIGSEKCVLFTNADTLYSTVAYPVNRSRIRDIQDLFLTRLEDTLLTDAVDPAVVQIALTTLSSITISTTQNKSVLGSMNEFAFHIKWLLEEPRALSPKLQISLAKRLNEMPSLVMEQVFPARAMSNLLAGQFGWRGSIHF